jgi:hypothetical protein
MVQSGLAKERLQMAKAKRGIDERHLKGIIQGMGARFSDAALARMMKAIHEGKPIRPPDEAGWDVGAMLLVASALVTRATALMAEKGSADKRAKRTASRRRTRTVQKGT